MKKLILSCSLLALTMPAYAAETINCDTLPTCTELGYTENASDCVGKKTLCPFDKTKATCVDSPHVGDLKYSLYLANHDGWLLCDGKQYSQTTYSKLYKLISTNFCKTYTSRIHAGTSGQCNDGYFAVPDYRGFYLRGLNSYRPKSSGVAAPSDYYGSALQYKGDTDTVTITSRPQYEQLPAISGTIGLFGTEFSPSTATGAFVKSAWNNYGSGHEKDGSSTSIAFSASRSNEIYNGSYVRPAHYGAYIFIYAGE